MVRTKRRLALTGSPLQNNLMEYWCMVGAESAALVLHFSLLISLPDHRYHPPPPLPLPPQPRPLPQVDWVREAYLGSRQEFANQYVNPIVNGQARDSTAGDVRLMKRRYCTARTVQHALCTMHYALCTMHYALCTMHHAPCTMHHALTSCRMTYVGRTYCTPVSRASSTAGVLQCCSVTSPRSMRRCCT
jgi:hypothetical protein